MNLADEGNFDLLHIHHKCHEKLWKQLPDVEKIKLRLLFQQSVTGGDLTRVIGEVRQAIVAFHSLLGLAMREYEHRSPEEYGAGEN